MQALQVMSRLADTITTLPDLEMRGMAAEGEYSATPIRLYENDNGVWFIQYAVYNEEPIYGEPPQYAMTEAVALGERGTSMVRPSDAGEYARYHYANLVTDGFVEAYVRGESGNSPRNMFTPGNISAVISNAVRATMVSAGVGYIIDVIDSYIKAAERLNAAQRFLEEGALYRGISYLGGRICFTPISGVNIVHGINLQTGEALLRTASFLYTHDYEITVEQLHMIILNGNQDTGARPIESIEEIGITAGLQRAIMRDFQKYIETYNASHEAYRDALGAVADDVRDEITDLFGEAYDVDTVVYGGARGPELWSVEILAYIIARHAEGA